MAEIGDRIEQNLINYLEQPKKVSQNDAEPKYIAKNQGRNRRKDYPK